MGDFASVIGSGPIVGLDDIPNNLNAYYQIVSPGIVLDLSDHTGSNIIDGHLDLYDLTVMSGSGNDNILGGYADDSLGGGTGSDTISGNIGDDRLDGDDGYDWLSGGLGDDTVLGGKGNDGVASIVKGTPGSIGYVELAYATQNRIPFASLRNKSGVFVSPSVAGATAAAQGASKATARDPRALIVYQGGKAYPISGYTFIMFYKNSTNTPKGKQVVKFLKWAVGPGQKYAASLQYAPLPRAVVAVNKSKLR